jgi:1-acyl-sn-glycerol-3-phosphate acyltransferase
MADPLGGALRRGLRHMVRRGLRGVWQRGDLPAGPFVWAANHHSWWDPFVAAVVLGQNGRAGCLMMAQENLDRFGFARRLGVFGTTEGRRGLEFLHDGRVLVIYPEGELRPAGPLGGVRSGAAWFAERAGVPLFAVATRVAVRGHQAPEAYLSGVPVGPRGARATARLGTLLNAELSDVDGLLATTDPRAPLPGFDCVLPGRRSWDERVDAMSRRRA